VKSTTGFIILSATLVSGFVRAAAPAAPDNHMDWWREAKFGMFIHWGLYAQAAGEWNGQPPGQGRDQRGEWLMEAVRMPVADYAKMAATFNPVKFDADQWVAMAKDAGVKYIVFTAKHHEGFAMFQTKVSAYNIIDATPFKRDPLRELSAACQKYGIKLGIYYSQTQDWYHPGGFVYKTGPWDPVQTSAPFDDYLNKVSIPQITELLTNYGPVAELWWDTPGSTMTRERCEPIAQLVAKLQPGVIMNNLHPVARFNHPPHRYRQQRRQLVAQRQSDGYRGNPCRTSGSDARHRRMDEDQPRGHLRHEAHHLWCRSRCL
jgi:alpha-L-fucosidase